MSLLHVPNFMRPREKLVEKGVTALRDDELLAVLLGTGYKKKNVLQVAQLILTKYGIGQIPNIGVKELSSIKGVGKVKAAALCAAVEIGKRAIEQDVMPSIQSPEDVLKVVSLFKDKKREHFIALYLNARHQLIQSHIISIGSVDMSIAHPREVYEPAIRCNAAGLVVAHNHPSGDSEPSNADIMLTRRLLEAGNILDIKLKDHVIITHNSFCSLKQNGLM